MANRYYIGGTGDWSDIAHWSLTSGGVGGQAVPTSVDDVFIDDNSGGSGFVLTCDVDPSAKTFTDDRGNAWELAGSSKTLRVYGNIIVSINCNISSEFNLFAPLLSSDIYIHTSDALCNDISLSTVTVNFFTDFTASARLLFGGVKFPAIVNIENGSKFKGINLIAVSTSNGEFNLKAGTLELNFLDDADIQFLVLDSGTSLLKLLDSSKVFESGSLIWYDVELEGNNITINGSPTMNQLKVTSGNTVNIQAGQTITLSDLAIDNCSLIGL